MRFPIAAMTRRLLSVDRGSLRLAGLNLVAGIVITTGLVLAARDTAYPPAVGLALALFVGGGMTGLTVWASLHFGRDGEAEDSRGGKDRRGRDGRES